ncbi:hypothetical protein GUJ93_ZPchr0012g18906 [Zizania palustris]|uniref:Uncharacterized protein n=1 Tax=Zizania palustris TaxID=103762 RepID=A0A8J6BWZ0_ZIZPA|nr:hypothetical protein GUJ93_ZPchr0012g18906 [Zizania palustris]
MIIYKINLPKNSRLKRICVIVAAAHCMPSPLHIGRSTRCGKRRKTVLPCQAAACAGITLTWKHAVACRPVHKPRDVLPRGCRRRCLQKAGRRLARDSHFAVTNVAASKATA